MTQQGPQSPGSQQQPQTGTQPPAGQPVAQPPSAGLSGPVPRADFGQRLGAILIDSVLTGVAGLIVFLIFGAIGAAIAATGSNAGVAIGGLIGTLGILLWIALPFIYFGYMEGQPSGQTVGKRVLNIRVVDFDTAGPIGVGRGVLRTLARILSGAIFLPRLSLDALGPRAADMARQAGPHNRRSGLELPRVIGSAKPLPIRRHCLSLPRPPIRRRTSRAGR